MNCIAGFRREKTRASLWNSEAGNWYITTEEREKMWVVHCYGNVPYYIVWLTASLLYYIGIRDYFLDRFFEGVWKIQRQIHKHGPKLNQSCYNLSIIQCTAMENEVRKVCASPPFLFYFIWLNAFIKKLQGSASTERGNWPRWRIEPPCYWRLLTDPLQRNQQLFTSTQ